MKLLEAMTTYFMGEKVEALVFILPIGLLSLVFGGWLLSEGGAFGRGLAIPFMVLGLVMSGVGGAVGFRAPSQVAAITAAVEASPDDAFNAERTRMGRISKAFTKYVVAWAILGVLGLALRFGTRSDFTQGLGIALVFFSGVLLMVDGFAERRAHAYAAVLESSASTPR